MWDIGALEFWFPCWILKLDIWVWPNLEFGLVTDFLNLIPLFSIFVYQY